MSDPSYSEAKALSDRLNAHASEAGAVLKAFPRLPSGLVPDAIRLSAEYQLAKAAYDRAFAKLRAFNASFTRQYAAELRADRRARKG